MRIENACFIDHMTRLDARRLLDEFHRRVRFRFDLARCYRSGMLGVVDVDPGVKGLNKFLVGDGVGRGVKPRPGNHDIGGGHALPAVNRARRLTLVNGNVVPCAVAGVKLSRPTNAVGVGNHLVPVSDPADGAAHCEDDGKHGGGDTQGFEDDA